MSVRRTWDKDEYTQKAEQRAWREQYEQSGNGNGNVGDTGTEARRKIADKEEFKAAAEGSAGPMGSSRAFIQARRNEIVNTNDVGKVKVVTAAQMEVGAGAGFYCEVCKCLLKDNRAYVSHINGKNHQRALGFSMRVERKGVSSVKDKLAGLKRKLKGEDVDSNFTNPTSVQVSTEKEKDGRVVDDAIPPSKKQKDEKEEEEDVEVEAVDPEMAAMMGFGGFGGGKKKR